MSGRDPAGGLNAVGDAGGSADIAAAGPGCFAPPPPPQPMGWGNPRYTKPLGGHPTWPTHAFTLGGRLSQHLCTYDLTYLDLLHLS